MPPRSLLTQPFFPNSSSFSLQSHIFNLPTMEDDNTNNGDPNNYEDEETEEALSLCDFPLHNEAQDLHDLSTKFLKARSFSSTDHFFEFFSDQSSDGFMCSADDIIVSGKLIPFKENSLLNRIPPKNGSLDPNHDHQKKQTAFRRRSESLSGIETPVTRSSSTKKKVMMSNSRSLDYRKLQRQSSMVSSVPEMERNSSVRSLKSDKKSASCNNKPKWSFLLFGIVRFPTEMDLSDIKSRQVRKTPTMIMFPDTSRGKYSPVSRRNSGNNKCSWKLLRALSCKDHESVSVTVCIS